jgi:hypothetical protein
LRSARLAVDVELREFGLSDLGWELTDDDHPQHLVDGHIGLAAFSGWISVRTAHLVPGEARAAQLCRPAHYADDHAHKSEDCSQDHTYH